ncbi:MAG: homoserine dehydrogenase [Anaerolineaceae bacterium]
MEEKKIILIGFGNVARSLGLLLEAKQETLKAQYGFSTRVVGIATAHHGMVLNPNGIKINDAISLVTSGSSLNLLPGVITPSSISELIRSSGADVLFENSPVNYFTGQPAIDHLRSGLKSGMHAITANKGPVVHAYRELTELAKTKGRRFLFESSVMDGAPIFSLFRGALPAIEVKGFRGILNSTTNIILELMEQGKTFDEAVKYSQEIGLAETDPSGDIDGWDAAVKVSALATVIMGIPLKPDQVDRSGIRGISSQMTQDALAAGERWKLICSAQREGNKLVTKVAPERVSPNSIFYGINGSSSYVQFETDALPGLGIVESNPSPLTTAYGLLADLVNAMRNG